MPKSFLATICYSSPMCSLQNILALASLAASTSWYLPQLQNCLFWWRSFFCVDQLTAVFASFRPASWASSVPWSSWTGWHRTCDDGRDENVVITRSLEPRRERTLLNAAQESLAIQVRSKSQSNGKIVFCFCFLVLLFVSWVFNSVLILNETLWYLTWEQKPWRIFAGTKTHCRLHRCGRTHTHAHRQTVECSHSFHLF